MRIRPIIAVDYDDTLVSYDTGEINEKLFDALKKFRKAGGKVILWTCRNDAKLYEAVVTCAEYGLCFDAINHNTPEEYVLFKNGHGSPKVFAQLYIDDLSQENISQALEKIEALLNEFISYKESGEEIYDI